MKPIIFLLVFFLFLPTVLALDCNDVANKQWCEDIQNSLVSDEEKEYLLADVISDKKHYPSHDLVSDWNKEIPTNQASAGVTKQSQGYIKDAWVQLLTVMPSVLYEEDLLIDSNGEVLTGANHKVQFPSGNDAGDCQTKRYLVANTGTLQIFLNEELIGTDNLVNYVNDLENNDNVEIKAQYNVFLKTKIKHYKWKKKYNSEGYYKWICEYHSTEYKTDNLVVEDNLQAKIHKPELEAEFKIKDKYLETTKADFTFSDLVNIELTFFDSYFMQHNYVFSEVFSLEPLNVLTVKAEAKETKDIKNLAYNDGEVVLENIDGCQIRVHNFFHSKLVSCDLSFTSPEFTIEIDQKVYNDKEKIKVKIEPSGDYIVEYADKEFNSNDEIELEAEYPYNRITVKNKNRIVNKHIHVKNEKPLALCFSLGMFGMINSVLISLIKKYWGVLM